MTIEMTSRARRGIKSKKKKELVGNVATEASDVVHKAGSW